MERTWSRTTGYTLACALSYRSNVGRCRRGGIPRQGERKFRDFPCRIEINNDKTRYASRDARARAHTHTHTHTYARARARANKICVNFTLWTRRRTRVRCYPPLLGAERSGEVPAGGDVMWFSFDVQYPLAAVRGMSTDRRARDACVTESGDHVRTERNILK